MYTSGQRATRVVYIQSGFYSGVGASVGWVPHRQLQTGASNSGYVRRVVCTGSLNPRAVYMASPGSRSAPEDVRKWRVATQVQERKHEVAEIQGKLLSDTSAPDVDGDAKNRMLPLGLKAAGPVHPVKTKEQFGQQFFSQAFMAMSAATTKQAIFGRPTPARAGAAGKSISSSSCQQRQLFQQHGSDIEVVHSGVQPGKTSTLVSQELTGIGQFDDVGNLARALLSCISSSAYHNRSRTARQG